MLLSLNEKIKLDISHNKNYVFGIDVKMMSSIWIVGESQTLTSVEVLVRSLFEFPTT